MRIFRVPANYYQQFDADAAGDVPGEGFGGWKRAEFELAFEHTAVVVMHAWDTGRPGEFPGWRRCIEYHGRADAICETVFPRLLGAVRRAGLRLYHVTGGGTYGRAYPGYRRAAALAGPEPAPPPQVAPDPLLEKLCQFRRDRSFVGAHNRADVEAGFRRIDFAPAARPQGEEGVAETTRQLFALCQADGVNHLLYAGFAINWCLLLSPGGMAEMARHGVLCSAFRQAVTAVENRETARQEINKQVALWRVALAFGLVFDVEDFVQALECPA